MIPGTEGDFNITINPVQKNRSPTDPGICPRHIMKCSGIAIARRIDGVNTSPLIEIKIEGRFRGEIVVSCRSTYPTYENKESKAE